MDDAVARDLLKLVGSWEGFEVVGVSEEANADGDVFGLPAPRLVLVLQPTADHVKRCSTCGAPVDRVHDVSERRVRDLPKGEWDTWLVFPRVRVACPRCGPTVEAVVWLDRYQRMTTRLAEKIARMAQASAITHVAAWMGVSWDTVKQIDQQLPDDRLFFALAVSPKIIAVDQSLSVILRCSCRSQLFALLA